MAVTIRGITAPIPVIRLYAAVYSPNSGIAASTSGITASNSGIITINSGITTINSGTITTPPSHRCISSVRILEVYTAVTPVLHRCCEWCTVARSSEKRRESGKAPFLYLCYTFFMVLLCRCCLCYTAVTLLLCICYVVAY